MDHRSVAEPQWATFDDRREGVEAHPLLAIIVAVAVLLMGLAIGGVTPAMTDDPRQALVQIGGQIGISTAIGFVLVWGVAYAVTLRHAALGWKIGSFFLILLVAFLVSLVRVAMANGEAQQKLRADRAEAAEILQEVLDRGDSPPARVRAGRGPIARMSSTLLNGILADRHAFDRAAMSLGLPQVVSFEGLTQNSPVLRNCDQLAPLAGRARDNGRRWATHLAAARAVGETAVRAGELPAGAVDNFLRGAPVSATAYQRQWTLTAQIAEESVPVCRILARRRWIRQGDRVLFETDADLAAANDHLGRVQSWFNEMQGLQAVARTRAQDEIDGLRPEPRR